MQRICFTLQIKKDRMAEYKRRHADVWPEMRRAPHDTGWRNYSLFLRNDGLLFGYLETEDFEQARAGMARLEVNRRWQAEMAEFFEGDPTRKADEKMSPLEEIFHLP